jgi:hypothetical protein
MLSRSVPTVLVMRTYLRRNKGYGISLAPAFIASIAGIFLTAWLGVSRIAPWTAVVFAVLFAARTFFLLGGYRRFTAKSIGLVEMVFGVVMVYSLAATWRL